MSAASCRELLAVFPLRTDLELDGLGDRIAAAPFRLQLQLILVGFCKRKLKPEGGADLGLAHHLHLSTVLLEDAPHDREPQSGAHFRVNGIFHSEETIEDTFLIGATDAAACVGDLHPQLG